MNNVAGVDVSKGKSINESTRDQFSSELIPCAFSFFVFLFQTWVPLLRFSPQIIGGQHLPPGIGSTQVQSRQFFGEVSFRVKSDILHTKPLPNAQSIK